MDTRAQEVPDWSSFDDRCEITVQELPKLSGETVRIATVTFYDKESGAKTCFAGEYSHERMEDSITNIIRHGRL
ncbi:hypothetical protein BST95_09040 [Halioglobus japonicus]|uniref:Uncharacterized protein n=1 Tax=Halioglobus japonicus TaxID=930805 RepID=A0AAP8MFA0_9GAMM|nr:hypothetical protein [Halioglobus japonicus]AQA18356.1 hypothetical protein BST95_09040 [Halioglobus japonicus]PLW86374.1 hypothetical protein C0029_08080 [Halioglobus japonicus]GHD13217.1 hypothetical protein GCM10007052_15100 [Halioglobus japonicus]